LLVKRGFHGGRPQNRAGIVGPECVRISSDPIDENLCDRFPVFAALLVAGRPRLHASPRTGLAA
jgi:hypothetical protein